LCGQTGGRENSLPFFDNIDEAGYVYILGMGKIKAEGRTTTEIAADIQQKVNENFMPEKAEARVFLEGIRYSFVTDVDGKNFVKVSPRATLSIMEAIAENGGLDRHVDRRNIVVYRMFPEGIKKAQIDLTREDILNSPYFWVQNGDIYMFNTRSRSFYGFGKEPIQTLTTGVSLLTTALSIYLLFSRF
jgi:polysaccharide export outer membrane protein